MSESNHYEPDQPYHQLDGLTREVAEKIAADPLHRWATDGAEVEEQEPLTPREFAWTKMLLENLPAPDFPDGLPPKLLELWQEENRRNGILPPDSPQ